LYELGRSRVGLKIPTSVSNHGEVIKDSSSFTKEAISAHPSNEVPNKPLAIIEKPAAAVLLETPYQQSAWVMVLLPARVHTGPSVDTSSIFIRLEHRSASGAIGPTGLKLSNRALRKRAGSITNT
jgi:hypothetical protein